jgi:predicted phage terminase large subunit-like protein
LITEHHDLLGVNVSPDSSANDRWDIADHSGGMYTAGVGGAITGKGADLFIIDDPVKNAEQAHSPTYRKKTYEWYESTAYTRLEPGGAVIIIQTRWNKEDLSGKILTKEGEKWTLLSLPALAGEDDPLGRAPGEALFKERFDNQALAEIKETIGPYWFAALYQQNPVDDENALFKSEYIQYCNYSGGVFDMGDRLATVEESIIFQTCDPAASKRTTADYFVLCTWALTPSMDLILLDVLRLRLTGPDQIKLFKKQFNMWHPVAQFVEQAGVGYTLYQFLEDEGLPVKPLKPGTQDKVTRAIPAAAKMAAGKVFIISAAQKTWGPDFIDELLTFPLGAKDDQVDCLSYAIIVLSEVKRMRTAFNYAAMSKKRAKKM